MSTAEAGAGLRPDTRIALTWSGEGLRFDGGGEGDPSATVDGARAHGPSPMQALLMAVAGCTGADIVEILTKMRVRFDGLAVSVDAERALEPPRRYTRIRLRYEVQGAGPADEDKVRRAVALSHETYCSALHSLREDIILETEVHLR